MLKTFFRRLFMTKSKLLAVGDSAPGFSLPDTSGKQVSLQDYAGKKLIIWFYPVADTPG